MVDQRWFANPFFELMATRRRLAIFVKLMAVLWWLTVLSQINDYPMAIGYICQINGYSMAIGYIWLSIIFRSMADR